MFVILKLEHADIIFFCIAVEVRMLCKRRGSELLFMRVLTKIRVLPSHRLDRIGAIATMRSRDNGLLLCVEIGVTKCW